VDGQDLVSYQHMDLFGLIREQLKPNLATKTFGQGQTMVRQEDGWIMVKPNLDQ